MGKNIRKQQKKKIREDFVSKHRVRKICRKCSKPDQKIGKDGLCNHCRGML